MADNSQWPSEDEDFDAVHTGGPITTTDTPNATESDMPKPSTSVKIISEDDDEPEAPAADSESEQVSDATSEVMPESEPETSSEPDTAPADETPETEPHAEPESAGSESSEETPEASTESVPETPEASASAWPTEVKQAEPDTKSDSELPSEPEASSESVADTQPEPVIAAVATQAAVTMPKSSKGGMKNLGRLVVELLLVVAIVGLGWYAMKLNSDKTSLTKQLAAANANPQLLVQKQTDAVIHAVGLLVQLPKDETPTVANVSDAAQAKKQSAFFANAQDGDKVLMYVKAGEAILYRPSTNKIILVAPLTFTNSGTTTSTTPATTSTTKKP